jgi:site-specific DNA recombinase
MTKVIGYIRVSTEQQAEQGVSLDEQRNKLIQYASLYDLELVRIEVDTLSGKTIERVGLQNALQAIGSGEAEGLLVAKLDRLTRSVRDLGEMIDQYFQTAALLSVSEQIDTRSAGGRLVLNVLASVSQWEREVIGERTSAALRHKVALGEHVGRPRYGFKVINNELVHDDAEQQVLDLVRRYRRKGLTLQAIAKELTVQGFKTRKGTEFNHTQVNRMAA